MAAPASLFSAWESYYVIVGSSSGALIGLQFVVMTLIAESGPTRSRGEAVSAFSTPTVVHFCAALLVAAILSVPWGSVAPAGVAIALEGLLGLAYAIVVLRRPVRQSEYAPVLEDWVWHNALPILAYVTLFLAGLTLPSRPSGPLLAIGGAPPLFGFIRLPHPSGTVTTPPVEV